MPKANLDSLSGPYPEVAAKTYAVFSQTSVSDAMILANASDFAHESDPGAPHRGNVEISTTGSELRNQAYHQACTTREHSEQQLLSGASFEELLRDLQREDEEHEQVSLFQKGVHRLSPVLNGVNSMLSLANPISSIEPSASSALAIVQIVTNVSAQYTCETDTLVLSYAKA